MDSNACFSMFWPAVSTHQVGLLVHGVWVQNVCSILCAGPILYITIFTLNLVIYYYCMVNNIDSLFQSINVFISNNLYIHVHCNQVNKIWDRHHACGFQQIPF